MTNTFDTAFQNKALTMALRDPQFANQTAGLIEPSYFESDAHGYLIDFNNTHFERYKELPTPGILIAHLKDQHAKKLIKDDLLVDVRDVLKVVYGSSADLSNREWTVEQVAEFAKQRAMEQAIEKSIDVLDTGKPDYTKIEDLIRKAISVGANEGTGKTNYKERLKARISERTLRLTSSGTLNRGITTGHRELDDLLYHKGWGRKELNILMAGAKGGKSTGLQHFALNAVRAGYKVLYFTLENSKEVTEDRMDAATSGVAMRDLDTSGPTIERAVEELFRAGGVLEIQEFAGGTCAASDIRRVIEKFKGEGLVFDLLVVDYADEMRAERKHNDERHAFKEIYQGLRAVGIDENLAVLTATQTNRAGNKATTATKEDVSEDFNKVRLADVLLTLNATEEEKKRNEMRIFFAAMRNSEDGIMVHCLQDRKSQKFISRIVKVA